MLKDVLSANHPPRFMDVPSHGYRADLQALRGIAVLIVLLFHLHVPYFQGGFIGVDIFFVLSGYFIARTLTSDGFVLTRQRVLKYFNRRIRRVIPLTVFMCLVILATCAFILPPPELKTISEQIIAAATGRSNFLYVEDDSYFRFTLFRPLLHFWSLAVEYQYYFYFPILYFLIYKRWWSGLVFLFASMAWCVYLAYNDPREGFFLIQSRLWEFLFGFYAAIYEGRIKTNFRWLPYLCLAVIACCTYFYSSDLAFPGWYAIIPAFCTFLLILNGVSRPEGLVTRLPFRVLEWLGNLSFSIYLWHFPVLWAFTYEPFVYYSIPDLHEGVWIVLVTTALSVFSYRFIETPFRKRSLVPDKLFYIGFAVCYTALFAVAYAYKLSDYSVRSYTPQQQAAIDAFSEQDNHRRCERKNERPEDEVSCLLAGDEGSAKKRVLLIGNSHATAIKSAFVEATKDNGVAFYIYRTGDMFGVSGIRAENYIGEIENRKITDVVIHALITKLETYTEMERFVDLMLPLGIKVHIIDPTPVFEEGVPMNIYLCKSDVTRMSREKYRSDNAPYFEWKAEMKKRHKNAVFYSIEPYLCPEQCEGMIGGKVLYFDSHHLTNTAALRLIPIVQAIYGF